MRIHRLLLIVLLAALSHAEYTSAQGLTLSLFERYLEPLRQQAGIPGLSAAVLQNGVLVWDRGFGRQDLDASIAATADTPYPIDAVSQTVGATLLLRKCVDEGYLTLDEAAAEFAPAFPDSSATIRQLLTHTAPGGGYRYDLTRVSALTGVVEACADEGYDVLLTREVFERFGMKDSVPGAALAAPTNEHRERFTPEQLTHYAAVLRRMAVPYRVDAKGRATRSDVAARPLSAATGIVTTVRDLARFDGALRAGALLDPETLQLAWTRATAADGQPIPTGLGWFVQSYNGEPIIWQFGVTKDAYSSLVLKVPNRGLTLILLANSDGLSAPFALENGDVNVSAFANLFLRLFLP